MAEDVEDIPTAAVNNAAFAGSVPRDFSTGSGAEEQELHDADKCNAKIHYLSRSIAAEHGINVSVIVTGFAYKLKFHRKNKWKERWWYYESIETLRNYRWPYLSDGCICESIECAVSSDVLIKDCNNKLSYDRTSWYAMDDRVRDAALSDVLWFDVRVAKKLGVPAGLVYHNLRFHLRKILEADPECLIPYQRVNRSLLARLLPMSRSTVKRVIKTLEEAGLIIPHATKKGFFTIADSTDLYKNGSNPNANGSSANANGSFMNGSKVNASGSSANANGSNVNANGSNLNDYTQYEANRKPFRNHSQTSECVGNNKNTFGVGKADKRQGQAHSDKTNIISDTVGSAPPGGKENTDTSPAGVYSDKLNVPTFDQIIAANKQVALVIGKWDRQQTDLYQSQFHPAFGQFCCETLSLLEIQRLFQITNPNHLAKELHPLLCHHLSEQINSLGQDAWSLYYHPMMEALIGGILYVRLPEDARGHTIEMFDELVYNTHDILMDRRETAPSLTAKEKAALFRDSVVWNNKYGWDMGDDSRETNLVALTKAGMDAIHRLFEDNSHLAAGQVINVLWNCILISRKKPKEGYDASWHARQGTNLVKFVRWIDVIVQELDMFQDCPVTMQREEVVKPGAKEQ